MKALREPEQRRLLARAVLVWIGAEGWRPVIFWVGIGIILTVLLDSMVTAYNAYQEASIAQERAIIALQATVGDIDHVPVVKPKVKFSVEMDGCDAETCRVIPHVEVEDLNGCAVHLPRMWFEYRPNSQWAGEQVPGQWSPLRVKKGSIIELDLARLKPETKSLDLRYAAQMRCGLDVSEVTEVAGPIVIPGPR